MDRGAEYKHGFDEALWEEAKSEAKLILQNRARRSSPISYSEFCQKLSLISFDPHDTGLAHFLGQISTEEHEAGRALLSALVVHKHDNQPGDGFFNLAESLGFRFKDREQFWLGEIEKLRSS